MARRQNILRRGSKGEPVRNLQRMLNAAGYQLAEDGMFGPKTRAAVLDFQARNGLQVDGQVGGQTMTALMGQAGGVPREKPGLELQGSMSASAGGGAGAYPVPLYNLDTYEAPVDDPVEGAPVGAMPWDAAEPAAGSAHRNHDPENDPVKARAREIIARAMGGQGALRAPTEEEQRLIRALLGGM